MKSKSMLGVALLLTALVTAGCLVSGTFILVDDFDFTTTTGFYFDEIDLTEDSDWNDHKDDIDDIDVVGFEVYLTNTGSNSQFEVWVDVPGSSGQDHLTEGAVRANATRVLNIPVTAGAQLVTYAQSLSYLENIATLKTLVKAGQFDVYGLRVLGSGASISADSGKVIVTFSASGS